MKIPTCFALLLCWPLVLTAQEPETYDIVIYGGTSSGLVAGFQAIAMGKSVVVIEPTSRPGGLTTGGLGQTDIGNKMVIGGLSRKFYEKVAQHYAKPENWKWQEKGTYKGGGQSRTNEGETALWTFEPSAALKIYEDWIADTGLKVVYNERLNRESGVKKEGSRIVSIEMESGRVFAGKIFMDTTYEGDLFAAAGVSYTVGRESIAQYDESYNGVQTLNATHHNFVNGVDPYVVAGDPSSGLLPFIDPDGPGEEGSADHRVQAYCFRMCLTNHPENRIPFAKPEGYQEIWYELLFRNYEAGFSGIPWINSGMPNKKTDTNNKNGFSTDFIGQNYDYPEASYEEREAIVERHRLYQQGLMWTLANHPRIPEKVRNQVSLWGTCKDEFAREDGWQEQLYIREARRMVGEMVMTQNHCQQVETVADSVGMGAYTMDSHNTQRYVTEEGFVKNEGDVQKGGFPPYPISYRSLLPKREEVSNLLVPVSLSASHMAFGSIRMEPVFMVLGQSAATAASFALDDDVALHDLDYAKLQTRLEEDGQILNYKAPPRTSRLVHPKSVDGVVVDDTQAKLTGGWAEGGILAGILKGYRHDDSLADGAAKAVFTATLPAPGQYDVQVAYSHHSNRSTNVPVTIQHEGGSAEVKLNQKKAPAVDKFFTSVGTYTFGSEASVTITNEGTDGYTVIDAVRWLPVKE